MKHTEEFRINSHDADVNDVVRPSAVLRYMQETANLQFESHHPTLNELKRDGKAFLLSRMNMSVYSPLRKFDRISVSTWPCEGRGAAFMRCSQIHRDGILIAEQVGTWALVDLNTKRLLRHGEIEFEFGTDEMLELDMPVRFTIPRDLDMVLVGERTVYYGDIDLYGHMNNTNYPDMLCAFIPSMSGKMVARCSIAFLNEAPLGETFKVYRAENDDGYYFRTVRSDGATGVEAEIVLDEI
ncbi:MAG: hypothetical protein IJR90_03750 [Clostridia bacterium]|nr:hypothetical protein [Clostridia bacterium]